MTYVVIKDQEYPAEIFGLFVDRDWDNRDSKTIRVEMDYELANSLFVDGASWKIKQTTEYSDDVAEEPEVEEFDNSEYNVRGDLTVHTDGTISVKMGKPTELEIAYELLYGGK